jgi:hypothetical protein
MPPPETAAPPRRPDAVIVPKNYPAGFQGGDRGRELNRRFGPLLGAARVSVTAWMGGAPDQTFVRPEGFDPNKSTQRFHNDSALAGRDRYEWFVADENPDGTFMPVAPVLGLPGDAGRVRLGYALDEAELIEAERAEAADPEYEAALEAAKASPETRARMARSGLLPGAAPKDAARASVRARKEGA